MVFGCDSCGRLFTNKRNLVRHISEKHVVQKFWSCCVCAAKIVRRSNLVSHLERRHQFTKLEARRSAVAAVQRLPGPQLQRDVYIDVSDDDSILDIVAEIDSMHDIEAIEHANKLLDKDKYMPPLEDISDVEVSDYVSEFDVSLLRDIGAADVEAAQQRQ